MSSPFMIKKCSSVANRRVAGASRGLGRLTLLIVALTAGLPSPAVADQPDEGSSTWARERNSAVHALERAHEAAEQARAAAAAAKAQLDDFIASHFDELRLQGAAPLPRLRESIPARERSANPRLPELNRQLADLKSRRDECLNRLMPAHPDVLELEEQMAALSRKLALERPSAESAAPSATSQADANADPSPEEFLSSVKLRQQQAAATYEQAFARWQTAELDSQAGLAAERAAAQHLAQIKLARTPIAMSGQVLPTPFAKPLAQPPRSTNAQQQISQPLALAVLLIALAVAALAAVRLARSSKDAVFASGAEVSAILELPIVGMIPAAEGVVHDDSSGGQVRQYAALAGRILLAVLVFAAVAYLVQNLSNVWQFSTGRM